MENPLSEMNNVIDFSKPLPDMSKLLTAPDYKMIYAAGDGIGGYPNNNSRFSKISNIEFFSQSGYNIFCCLDHDYRSYDKNIIFLRDHPELILCYLTGDDSVDFPILQKIFKNTISLIDTDDFRIYPDSKTCFEMLKPGGQCINVNHRFVFGISEEKRTAVPFIHYDNGWGEPNFIMDERKGNKFTFTKKGTVFTDNTDISKLQKIQEKNNSNAANIERKKNANEWREIYVNKTKKLQKKGGKSTSSRTRKRRALKRK